MEWAHLGVDLIKSLAWPVVVFVIAWLFHDELRKKIPGLTKAGPAGVEFDVQRAITVQSSTSGELKELPGLARTPPIAAIEKSIHNALQLYKPETHVDLLVRHLAQSRLEAVFERVYGAIYGSQIAGLRELAKRGGKISMADAVKGFDEAKSRSAFPANVTFDLWLQFLKVFNLIEAEDNEIRMTDIGNDFLLYLSAKGLPENKPN
jgi:hypothetical protein